MYCRVPKLFRRGAQPRVCVFVPVCSDCGCVRTRSTKLAIHRNYSQTLIAFLWPTIFFPRTQTPSCVCVCLSVCAPAWKKNTYPEDYFTLGFASLFTFGENFFLLIFFPPFSSFFFVHFNRTHFVPFLLNFSIFHGERIRLHER